MWLEVVVMAMGMMLVVMVMVMAMPVEMATVVVMMVAVIMVVMVVVVVVVAVLESLFQVKFRTWAHPATGQYRLTSLAASEVHSAFATPRSKQTARSLFYNSDVALLST
jgi:hypothetical protein